jgi:hypothetical protein
MLKNKAKNADSKIGNRHVPHSPSIVLACPVRLSVVTVGRVLFHTVQYGTCQSTGHSKHLSSKILAFTTETNFAMRRMLVCNITPFQMTHISRETGDCSNGGIGSAGNARRLVGTLWSISEDRIVQMAGAMNDVIQHKNSYTSVSEMIFRPGRSQLKLDLCPR